MGFRTERDRGETDFCGLLLALRGRSGLSQRALAALLGASERAVQTWEAGTSYPSAERLKALIELYVQRGVFAKGRVAKEARALWEAAREEAPRLQAAFDEGWFAQVLASPASVEVSSAIYPPNRPASPATALQVVSRSPALDWGEAPDVGEFHGRTAELEALTRWVLDDGCRLVMLLGMGGMGKTTLAAHLARGLAPQFEHVYWRSLRNALPYAEWLAGAIQLLSSQRVVPDAGEEIRLRQLLDLLRAHRSLLVLDNFETVLEPGAPEMRYREGYGGYGQALGALSEVNHQSCLVLTSREQPPELASREGVHRPVRELRLDGIDVAAGRALLGDKGLVGDEGAWSWLISRYGGNPLALLVVGETIRDVFGGEIAAFLAETEAVFGDVRRLLDAQVGRLSPLERSVALWLAIEREPIDFGTLTADLGRGVTRGEVVEAAEGLGRRSVLEVAGRGRFTLQPVVLEYATDRLVRAVAAEVESGKPELLRTHALVKATAKDYVRQSQERLIGAPILRRLSAQDGEGETERRLLALLDAWRRQPPSEQGYGPGNAVNLLRLLRGDLRGLDLSSLAIRQAYLAEVDAQDASLKGSHFDAVALAESFSFPLAAALSGDGAYLAAGTSIGEVWLWRTADRTLLLAVPGHAGSVWTVAFSADGQSVASGGEDGAIRLWETSTGRLLSTMRGHFGGVRGVAFSADSRLLASSGGDGTVRLWEPLSGRPTMTLQDHAGAVWSVALSGDGRLLASGGEDGTIRLWDVDGGRGLAVLKGHVGAVHSVALSADGQLVASSGGDGTVRLWEAAAARPLMTLEGHSGPVWSVALSPDGQMVGSGGGDGTIRLWETSTGRPLASVQGHTSAVRGMALSADKRLLASVSGDGTVRLWEPPSGRPLTTLQGHTGPLWGVALSGDGRLVASGGEDGEIRLWETGKGGALVSLRGHTSGVRMVSVSADGQLVASGSSDRTLRLWEARGGKLLATLDGRSGDLVALSADGRLVVNHGDSDGTIRVWETSTGRPLVTLHGHSGAVWAAALSADGQLLASGGGDGTVRLWELPSGRLLNTLSADPGGISGVALSADGQLLAATSTNGTVPLWELPSGRLTAVLQGHSSDVLSVAISADGRLVASSHADGVLSLWEASTGRRLATLRGHTGAVWSVAISADGRLIASGGWDGTVRLWEASSGACLHLLRPDRPYERLDITGLTGVTEGQHAALLALGAVERPA